METPANPDAQPPVDPGVEKIDSTINSYPDPRESDGPLYESTGLSGRDAPGPSTTYIPREPSPPLPDFRPAQHPLDDEMDELDEDDEVLATLPIYLSPSLYPHLSVFQYPLHHNPIAVPVWARDRGKTVTSRVKEAAGRVEVEIPIDGNVNVWREERAKEVGFVSESQANGNGDVEGGYGFGGRGAGDKDKKKKSKKDEQAKAWGEKSRLTSEVVPYATGYYSGVIQDGALHLHPITRVLQMRTNLTYLDDRDTEQKEHKRRYAEDMDGDKKKKAAPAQSRPSIPVDETNDGSGSIKDFRHKMWSLVQREEEDPWQEYAWKEGDNDEVVAKMAKLLVPPEKQGRLKCTTRGLDYLNKA